MVNTFYDLFRHIYMSQDSPDSRMKLRQYGILEKLVTFMAKEIKQIVN